MSDPDIPTTKQIHALENNLMSKEMKEKPLACSAARPRVGMCMHNERLGHCTLCYNRRNKTQAKEHDNYESHENYWNPCRSNQIHIDGSGSKGMGLQNVFILKKWSGPLLMKCKVWHTNNRYWPHKLRCVSKQARTHEDMVWFAIQAKFRWGKIKDN